MKRILRKLMNPILATCYISALVGSQLCLWTLPGQTVKTGLILVAITFLCVVGLMSIARNIIESYLTFTEDLYDLEDLDSE